MSDPIAAARRAADAARAGVRQYEDAIMAEADRQERLENMQGKATRAIVADAAKRLPALAERMGLPGGGR